MEKRKMELLALVMPVLFLFFAQGVFSLQEVAGPLVISVPIGGSNSAQWGLLNDGKQNITVGLNATGGAAQYLSYPTTVDLQPGKIIYVNVTASVASNYNLGPNITGTLYELQVGQSGQVQVNVQLTKSVTIMVPGQSAQQTQTTTTSTTSTSTSSAVTFVNAGGGTVYVPTNIASTTTTTAAPSTTTVPTATISATTTTTSVSTTTTSSPSPITGLVVFASSPLGISLLLSLLVAIALIIIFYKKRNKKEKPEEIDENNPQ
jgi:hypothetical protein